MRYATRLSALAFLFFATSLPVFAATIETVAGGGFVDGVPATTATLSGPEGLAVDSAGNVYIGDTLNNRVRKITAATGVISTIAGSVNTGFSGDGGPATQASLSAPRGVALDPTGAILYIADSGNNTVRSVNLTSGVITTVAGTSKADFSGDGGAATAAALNIPIYVAVDKNGNLFISDSGNARVRKVDTSGNISTFAGNGTFGFSGDGGPATSAAILDFGGVAVDANLNVYICAGRASDQSGNVIRKVDTTGTITTICGTGVAGFGGDGGPATAAQVSYPLGIKTDAAGNIFFADNSNQCIRMINTAGIISTVAGVPSPSTTGSFGGDGGPALSASLSNPQDLALNAAGDLYIADSGNNRVRLVPAATKIIQTIAGQAGSGDGGPAVQATFNRCRGVAADVGGNLYISDFNSNRVRRVDATTGVIQTLAGTGVKGFAGDGGPAINSQLSSPIGIIIDRNGDVLFADPGNQRVRKVTTATGVITTIAGSGTVGYTGDGGAAVAATFNGPLFVAVDSKNQVYISDSANHVIRRVDASGNIATFAGTGVSGFSGDGGPATAAQLISPSGLAIDSADNLFFADFGNNTVRKVAAGSGTISTVAGTGNSADNRVEDGNVATSGAVFNPSEVAVDSNFLYINERDKSEVRIVSLCTGFIGPFAGTGVNSFLGDHGPPTAARLGTLDAIALDAAGNVYICDTFRVREINGAGSRLIDIQPFPTSPGLSTTFTTPLPGATYAWDFGDGSTGSGASVTHAYAAAGQFIATLTVTGGAGITITREVLVLAPQAGAETVGNVATTITPPKVPGREAISVVSAGGGVLQFGVDSSNTAGGQRVLISNVTSFASTSTTGAQVRAVGVGAGSRDTTDLIEGRSGGSFVQRFPAPGLYVVQSNHFANDNSIASKGRKTVAIGNAELNMPLPFTDNRTSKQVSVTGLTGVFQFSRASGSSGADTALPRATAATPADTVTLKATIALPSGIDLTQSQDVWIGVGNIVDKTSVNAKGVASITTTGNLKAFKVAYKKGKQGNSAGITAIFGRSGLVAAGFDTEGISDSEPDLVGKKSVLRKIQLQVLYAGLSYESQASVKFQKKTSKKGDTGSISFNRNSH